jgi:tetratricopeptide (TPR) repeat protein
VRLAGACALLLIAVGAAGAQSKKYPPEPVDKDAEEEAKSTLWESAIDPQRAPYESLLALAQQQIDQRSTAGITEAINYLDQAIVLVPGDARGYQMRGDAHMMNKTWDKCADDFGTAWAKGPEPADTDDNGVELRRKLGLCQARANRLPEAERTLADAAASGATNGELWMRLGEVRIAMGKLDEAIAALDAAREMMDTAASQALVRWLLAGAYDRARRPAEALEQARLALQTDRSLSTLRNPTLPFLGNGEAVYLLGLASEASETSRAEHALVYFRRFIAIAADSPWKKRAEEHLRDLKKIDFPEAVERNSGTAALDMKVADAAVRKGMPAMRACMSKLPYSVIGVRTQKLGPRSSTPVVRPRSQIDLFQAPRPIRVTPPPPPPPPSQSVYVQIEPVELEQGTQAELDAAIKCIEPLVQKLALPTPKEKDSYYTLYFRVVSQ